jgi:hypothetical protein
MAHSPHKRWSGHCLLCVLNGHGSIRGAGKAARTPYRDLRKLGKRRRLNNRRDYE